LSVNKDDVTQAESLELASNSSTKQDFVTQAENPGMFIITLRAFMV